MKALRVHGGEDVLRRISERVGGRVPMADRGEDAVEPYGLVFNQASWTSMKRIESSNADEGCE
jgi:hypothetical protein